MDVGERRAFRADSFHPVEILRLAAEIIDIAAVDVDRLRLQVAVAAPAAQETADLVDPETVGRALVGGLDQLLPAAEAAVRIDVVAPDGAVRLRLGLDHIELLLVR